jgi:hypothetical protein
MKVYMITSNKYAQQCCPINIYFLKKYWSSAEVTIVGYDEVLNLKNLPTDIKVKCLGKQEDFGKYWTSALIPFFKTIEEKYFTLIFEDHLLFNYVDIKKIKTLEQYLENDILQKVDLSNGIDAGSTENTKKYDDYINIFNQNCDYRLSLCPAIWTKDYFLKYLKPNMTAWDFEIQSLGSNSLVKKEKANIGVYKKAFIEERIYAQYELYRSGKISIGSDGKTTLKYINRMAKDIIEKTFNDFDGDFKILKNYLKEGSL